MPAAPLIPLPTRCTGLVCTGEGRGQGEGQVQLKMTGRDTTQRGVAATEWSAAVSAGPAAAAANPPARWIESHGLVCSNALRLVLRTQPRSENCRGPRRFGEIL